ncbi:MAG: hypothetical protein RL346_2157 [Verrucomicrobiota bacterium]|jgi:O-succinylbenzoate synthase
MEFQQHTDIWISPYRLRAGGFLNSISARRNFEGVLIRVGEGYGCVHPWPELGDPPLEKCLEDLKGRRIWPIVKRALRCAEYDSAARIAEESLFHEMEIPKSHATLVNIRAADVSAAVEAGFDTIKIKAGRNVAVEAKFLEEMSLAFPLLKWRVDFNEILDPEAADRFLGGMSEQLQRKIDFVEDICPFSERVWAGLWKKHRMPLAVDREAGPHRMAAQCMVIKPAVDEPDLLGEAALLHEQRAVITSYMDHPLGQAFAAWEAARTELIFPGLVRTCGLQTHHLFEKDAFVERLGAWKPEFEVPGGTGLGFDDELAALTWVRL